MQKRTPTARRQIASFLLVALALFGYGCASIAKPEPTGGGEPSPRKGTERPYGADLRSRLNYIIGRRLSESKAVQVLDLFSIENYDIQDQNTFWGHRVVAGSGSPFPEYYFTYRNKYFILFLQDKDTVNHACIDLRMIDKTKREYELNAGRVEVDGHAIDEEVVVLVNKTWNGEYSTDILVAFKPVVATRKIETLKYKTIRIYREE